MNSKERCLAAIHGLPVDRTPVFPLLMFFSADRYGVPYREFATNGHVLAESQLNIREMFAIDAITSCSDAFRISADLGGEMVYPEDKPPYLARPLVGSEIDLKRLRLPSPHQKGGRMLDRVQATAEMVRAVGEDCLVLGWVDMPFAEACSVCGVSQFMLMIVEEPDVAHQLLNFLTEVVIEFCLLQVDVGAPVIGAGDAAASLISARMYREFALPYEQRVCRAVHDRGGLVKLHICGRTGHLLQDMIHSGADLFNIDHLVDFKVAKTVFDADHKCYKGNLDPVADMLMSTPASCEAKALDRIRMAQGSRYMLSAGCEIPAGVSDETFHTFCRAADRFAQTCEVPKP